MNELKEKFIDFKSLNHYKFEYLLENGQVISFTISQFQFPHLIGLHKLTDLPLILMFNDPNNIVVKSKFIISKIKKEKDLTENIIKRSIHFKEIEERYNFLSREAILSLSFTEVIVDFDKSKLTTKLNSKYIFFEPKNEGYLHLGIVDNGKHYSPESFFFENSNYYLKNQRIVKVKQIIIYNEKKEIILQEKI